MASLENRADVLVAVTGDEPAVDENRVLIRAILSLLQMASDHRHRGVPVEVRDPARGKLQRECEARGDVEPVAHQRQRCEA